MLNVLHLINFTGGGGTESYIYSLAKKLHNTKCKFFIGYSVEGSSLKLFQDLGIETIKIQMNNPYDLKAAKVVANICNENSIDIIHTHFLRENYISILSKIFHNKALLINTRHMLAPNSKSIKYSNKFMTLFNHKIIAVSKAVESLLLDEVINPKKVKLIYTGVDLQNLNNDSSFRYEFNIDQDYFLITSVARFSEEKGHEFLIKSIPIFKKDLITNNLKDLKFKFILVGDGDLLEESKALSRNLEVFDDIIFTGYRHDINNILNACNIFVSHSKSEAFGISILEALAAGLPVISTDSGGTKEIINSEEKSGILIDYGNKDELSSALVKLVKDKTLINIYRENGLILLNEKFSLDKTSIETYNLYNYNQVKK